MIPVKPRIQYQSNCPHCGAELLAKNVFWPGINVCVKSECVSCKAEIIEDLRVGHSVNSPFQFDLAKGVAFGDEDREGWLGTPILRALQNPKIEEISITKEVFKQCNRVIILNCIDELYGHCLLKLLNAQRHLDEHPDYGLVVIVQKFIRWMVPEGVAEVWTVDISLKNGKVYYPSLDRFVGEESKRFENICVSKAYSHPSKFEITRFTRVPKHCFEQEELKITFVWREDRPWLNMLLFKVLRKLKMLDIALFIQNWKVRRLFNQIRAKVPSARLAIAGLGKKTKFPDWIEDFRVAKFDEKSEREVCKVYSESRLVIGVHGSNMLLPSAHAGMTIDLMPEGRWGNFAQDILYQEIDPRLAAFRYQYVPIETSIPELANIASSMIIKQSRFSSMMTADKKP